MAIIDIKADIPKSVIVAALTKAIEILINKYKQLGMYATGEFERELEGVADGNRGIIRGAHYTRQLVLGREPGKNPPVDPIEVWVNAKLKKTGKEGRSIAFAVAKKIGKEGTTWYQKGGSDLLEALEDNEVMTAYYEEIGIYVRERITAELRRELQNIS